VGFQTKMNYGAQTAVFKTIPGLENASFARLGGIHRNTFINSPALLDGQLRLKADPRVRFAGQVTGVEGYVESAAMGLVAGRMAAAERLGRKVEAPPATTALGALVNHITGGHVLGESGVEKRGSFQPMNVNYGLFPDIGPVDLKGPDGKRLKGADKGRARKRLMSVRALQDVELWLKGQMAPAAVSG
jgi:methylenetetrahydrofolate--tRNA-(uracil-5-)-methyltransferase